MKRVLVIVVLSFMFLNASAQSLTFDQLLHIMKQDVDDVDTYLSNRKWSFSSSEEIDEYSTRVAWSFNPSIYDSEKAIAWINLKFYVDGNNWLYYQIPNKETYNIIKQKVLSYGMKKIDSGANNDGLYSTYSGHNYVVVLGVTKVEGNFSDISTNFINIYPKKDYFEFIVGEENY